jgi:glutathione peroxidase
VQFPLFEKVDVNGPMTHPVYHFLRTKSVFYKTQTSEARLVPWTFSIFILNREGKVDSVYPPLAKKEEIEEDVKKLLL